MNGWPARSAASRKPHPKYTHPGRGAFCAPAVFAAGEMRLNGSKRRGQRARYHAKLRLPWSRARTPALVSFRLRCASQKRAAGRWPHRGQRARYHAKLRLPWPRARTPALVGLRLRFACGETARAVIGPTFWVCRAKSGAAFRCAKPPCAVVRFAAMTSSPRTNVLAYPAFASLKRGPSAKTPALDILPGHAIILISSK